jgi:phage-related protein
MCFREILYYEDYYLIFFDKLNLETQKKFNWTLQLIETTKRIPEKYFKHIEGTKGIYEIRVEQGSDIYRAFAFFDKGNLIVLGNGFIKKTQKTPKAEITKAIKIRSEYFKTHG